MNKIINKIPDWLRWVLLVPSIACYVFASVLIMKEYLEFIRVTLAYWGANIILISLFFVSVFIVLIAAYIAPKRKLLVASIFSALIFILFVFMIIYQKNLDIFSLICVSGPIAGFVAVKINMLSKKRREQLSTEERTALEKRTRRLYLAVCILFAAVAAGGIVTYFVRTAHTPGTLYVNGKEITSENVRIYSNYADLPFIEVLKALGINVEWVDNSTAEFICDGQKYTLNLAEETLTEYGDDEDFLSLIAPGTTFVHQIVLEKELILDSYTLLDNMHSMKKRIRISIDHEKSIVYVNDRED